VKTYRSLTSLPRGAFALSPAARIAMSRLSGEKEKTDKRTLGDVARAYLLPARTL
jgi:hypothetical protein